MGFGAKSFLTIEIRRDVKFKLGLEQPSLIICNFFIIQCSQNLWTLPEITCWFGFRPEWGSERADRSFSSAQNSKLSK
ncbi:MAG: hypothetical protein EA000_23865 [Oscillatoriales cyanobacterium]|nr:MAG: hypothetical protein EA000_23865 [Oscillatoriales cyanobacterium]